MSSSGKTNESAKLKVEHYIYKQSFKAMLVWVNSEVLSSALNKYNPLGCLIILHCTIGGKMFVTLKFVTIIILTFHFPGMCSEVFYLLWTLGMCKKVNFFCD